MPRDPIITLLERTNEHLNKIYRKVYPPSDAKHWAREVRSFVAQIAKRLSSESKRQYMERMLRKRDELINVLENVIKPFIPNPDNQHEHFNIIYHNLLDALEKLEELIGAQ